MFSFPIQISFVHMYSLLLSEDDVRYTTFRNAECQTDSAVCRMASCSRSLFRSRLYSLLLSEDDVRYTTFRNAECRTDTA
ncbi:hypothetical protein BaRGS_00029183, partial [Batillaria attramentaria]